MTARLSSNSRLAMRYAKALFEMATEQNVLAVIEKDCLALKECILSSKDLDTLLHTPLLSRKDKAEALAAILDKAGSHTLTKQYILVLAKNNRLAILANIIEAFSQLLAEERGEITAEVVSAVPLQASQVSAIVSALIAARAKKVKINPVVDQAILGGLVVNVGSYMLDSSLKSKLDKLKTDARDVASSLVA